MTSRAIRTFVASSVAAATLALAASANAEPVSTTRLWLYANGTALISPNWAFTAMPGMRYELARSEGEAKHHYMNELFVGPTYIRKLGAVKAKLAVWYYYMGYPKNGAGPYDFSHNVEVVPSFDWSAGRVTLTNRNIFHSTVFASVYGHGADSGSMESGYGLVMRNLIQLKLRLTPNVSALLGDEPFWGLVKDGEAAPHPLGFWPSGLRMNRMYGGVDLKLTDEISLTPQYVYETARLVDGKAIDVNHYAFVTFSYVWKAF